MLAGTVAASSQQQLIFISLLLRPFLNEKLSESGHKGSRRLLPREGMVSQRD